MKTAILGAGFAGLTAAYELNRAGHEVWIFERQSAPGGAAAGFREPGWDWYLDYAYHHLFTNDHDILSLAKEIGFKEILVRRPETATLYPSRPGVTKRKTIGRRDLYHTVFGDRNEIYKLDTPLDLLRFGRLPLADRVRTGLVLAALKFGPKLPHYDRITSERFLSATMGKKAYETLWKPLFGKKFTDYSQRIATSFFWARIKKRTPVLAYPAGGFQALANHFAAYLVNKGVKIRYNTEVRELARTNLKFKIENSKFDSVISTLPSPVFLKLENGVLPGYYRKRLEKIEYLGAQSLVLETRHKVFSSTYWLNIADPDNPWMVAVEHTNFMDKKHFNNHHLIYLANYTNRPAEIDRKLVNSPNVLGYRSFFIKYAQPLYTTEYHRLMPGYRSPVDGLYFASMEQTYPYDRGTNYAVAVGRSAAKEALKK